MEERGKIAKKDKTKENILRETYEKMLSITSHQRDAKQNITRDTETKNNLTVTRGEVGGDNGAGGRVFRNNYKGQMVKTKEGWEQGREVGIAGVGREWWGVNADNCT